MARTDPGVAGELTPREVLRIWAPHLAALLLPVGALAFLLTAPHQGSLAILVVVVVAAVVHVVDRIGGEQVHAPRPDLPAWPFDALLALLFVIQFVNVGLLAWFFGAHSLWSLDSLIAILLVGGSSGYSGIVVAHELIHRRGAWARLAGRALLCTVLYEHFYTEHIRGHHVRVGTPEDPATARFGDTFARFYFRTVPAQLRSAWRLETRRLGDESMGLLDRRQLGNRVLHGVVAEWSLALAILGLCGPASFAAFVVQAVFASRALEVVNYFEHWGLERTGSRVQPVDSWDTHSRFTYYALTGLTRHADHHAFAARPYQQLRVQPGAPLLPRGYIAMFPLVMFRNREFQRLMTEELRRRGLGPFAQKDSGEAGEGRAASARGVA